MSHIILHIEEIDKYLPAWSNMIRAAGGIIKTQLGDVDFQFLQFRGGPNPTVTFLSNKEDELLPPIDVFARNFDLGWHKLKCKMCLECGYCWDLVPEVILFDVESDEMVDVELWYERYLDSDDGSGDSDYSGE